MRIVVIGVGEVGSYLATTLSKEGHRVLVVDQSADALELATEHADLQTLCGHGAALPTLRDAGVHRSDLVLAVTGSDEVNLLATLTSKQLGATEVIARVANRAFYEEEGGVAHNLLGVDLIINPQVLAAMELHRVIRSFGALETENLADNRVEVVDLPVREKTRFLGKQLREIAMPPGILIAAIMREGRLLLPNGGDHVELNDHIWLVGSIDSIPRMEDMFGMTRDERAHRVMVVGGGEIGLEVARRLERDDVQTVIIEQDLDRCRELASVLKETLVLHGDGTNRGLLVEEEVSNCDAFLALSRVDETNIMACLLARGLDVRRSIALIHRGDYVAAAKDVGLDVAVSPRRCTANYILAHVRSEQVSRVVQVENGLGEILEIQVPGRARVLGRNLMYVDLPRGALIACVVREREVFVPGGTDEILPGDVVVIFTTPDVRHDVLRWFRDPKPESQNIASV